MRIGIDASRAFLKQRTGIEEYAYQIIKNLRGPLKDDEVILYTSRWGRRKVDFRLPKAWKVKEIPFGRFWTQVGLSIEMLLRPVDVLFVPAHTVPIIHPKNTVVTVHGLEYEHNPESYSLYSLYFHKFFVRMSCRWAKRIIAVSWNTKKDLKKYYRASKSKIAVIYNGFDRPKKGMLERRSKIFDKIDSASYVLFVGRLENRKNIIGIARAFDRLRAEHGYEGKLVLVGKPGYGHWDFEKELKQLDCRHYVVSLGFVSQKDKWQLLEKAYIFMFPSLSAGFGFPILEAQTMGTPVITSKMGPMDEVAGNDDILANPKKPKEIADLAGKLIGNKIFRKKVVQKGRENTKRFSWEKCGKEVAEVLKK